jgi:hypothetical protein
MGRADLRDAHRSHLGGARFATDPEVARVIFNKVKAMQITETYQFILDEGAVKHARQLILKMGREQIGEPTDKQKNKLSAIEDLERLDRIALKVLTAKSWDSLLRVK